MSATANTTADDQAAAIAFLSDTASYAARPAIVERAATHGAIVFLAGGEAFKMKRAVRLPYLDFSTLERRRAVLERELAINRLQAPEIYLGVSAITRERGGRLAFDGAGEPIEWVLRMRRFAEDAVLSEVAKQGPLAPELARDLAAAVHRFHVSATVAQGVP